MVTYPIGNIPQTGGGGTVDPTIALPYNNFGTDVQHNISQPFADGSDTKVTISTVGNVPLEFKLHEVDYTFATPFDFTLLDGTTGYPKGQTLGLSYSHTSDSIEITVLETFTGGEDMFPLAYIAHATQAESLASGFPYFQRTTDLLVKNHQGLFSRINEKFRLGSELIVSGCEVYYTSNDDGSDIQIGILEGEYYQMNKQRFASINMDDMFAIHTGNHTSGTIPKDYEYVSNLASLTALRGGVSILTGKYVVIDVYGIGNSSYGEVASVKAAIAPSEFEFDTLADANLFANSHVFKSLPYELRNVGFPLACIILKKTATGFDNGFTTTEVQVVNLWRNSKNQPSYRDWSSPGYPNNYPMGANDDYSFTATCDANETILLIKCNFSAFNTEQNYDYCYLDNSSSASSSNYRNKYHGYLGSFESPAYTGGVMSTKFTSDGSVARTGWNINTVKIYVQRTLTEIQQSSQVIGRA